jgi:hypothetical protein
MELKAILYAETCKSAEQTEAQVSVFSDTRDFELDV